MKRPAMATVKLSCCGGRWPSVPQVGHSRRPVWPSPGAMPRRTGISTVVRSAELVADVFWVCCGDM